MTTIANNASVLQQIVAERMMRGESQEGACAFLNRAMTYSYKGRGRLPGDLDEINAVKARVGLPMIPRPQPKPVVAAPVVPAGQNVAVQGAFVPAANPANPAPADPMAALLAMLAQGQQAAIPVPAPVDSRLAAMIAAGIDPKVASAMLGALPAPVQGQTVSVQGAVTPTAQGQAPLAWTTIACFAKTAKSRVYLSQATLPDGSVMFGIRSAALVPAVSKKGVAVDAKYVMARESTGMVWVMTSNGTTLSEAMFAAVAGHLGYRK